MPGNILSCYPDPYSARNAALDALAAGRIKHAQVVILEGNQYTIGSKDSSKNGSIDGLHANNGTIADIQFDSTTLAADKALSSIMRNGVDMYYATGANLTYINSSYAIYCVYLNDSTNNTYFKSNIYGEGAFYQVYGEVNGFMATFYMINDRNAFTSFHAREVILQQFWGFYSLRFSVSNIEIEDLLTSDAIVFWIGIPDRYNGPLLGNATNSPEMIHVKVKNWRFGKDQIPYPNSNDVWYGIELGENPWQEGTMVTFDIGNLYMYSSNYSPLFQVQTAVAQYNVRMMVNIDNLVQKDSHLTYAGTGGGLISIYQTGNAFNNSITYNIKSARIEAPLLGSLDFSAAAGSKGNRFNINVGDLQKDSSAFAGGLFNVTSLAGPADPMIISINGNFKSYDNKPMIYATNPLVNRWIFSGTYNMAHSGQPVAHFYTSTGRIMAFTDAILINDGTTPCIMADSTLSIPVYIKNVHANSTPTANIQLIGDTAKIVSDIPDFFK
jgi:hypothetical protein